VTDTIPRQKKTWSSQPDDVEYARVVSTFRIRKFTVEVRHEKPGTYLLSSGDLFGSQTLRCETAEVVFRALALISTEDTTKAGVKLPHGAAILENG